jgi:hypothetical protein
MLVTACTPSDSQGQASPASSTTSAATSAEAAPGSVAATPAKGDLLPDLTMLPLEAFHVAYEGDRKVLRFGAVLLNNGPGPLDIKGARKNVQDRDLHVTQAILQAEGGTREIKTKAIMRYEVEDGHDHFHVQNFERYQLRPVDSTEWRGSRKEGWCLRDDGNLRGHPQRYNDADFDCGADMANEALAVRQGITEGWADVYDWYLEGQYVDLDGYTLPGDFCVAADADPQQQLTETSEDNNSTSTVVHITETEVSIIRQGC